MWQQRRGGSRATDVCLPGQSFRNRVGIAPAVVLLHIDTARLLHQFGADQICPDVLQRSAVLRILLRVGQVKDNRLLRQICRKLLQRALRFARVRRHRNTLFLDPGNFSQSLVRNTVPGLLEHAQLPVGQKVRPLLTALSKPCPVLISDDLLLLLQQGGEPVHRGLQCG